MDLKLKDKVAIVTGAGSQAGYGKGICLSLAREGCHIVADDKDEQYEGAKKTAEECKALGVKAIAINADIRVREEVDELVKKTLEEFGKIDILINNAGSSTPMVPFVKTDRKFWEEDIETNLYGQMNMTQAVLPHMIERKYGKIVIFSGGQGIPNNGSYGASKAGAVAFAHSLAKEVGPLGITVNILMPGVGDTGLGGGSKALPPGFMEAIGKRSMLGRLCTPNDMGPAVAFLVSDVNSYMCGQLMQIGAM
jgi:NAD(P)-dependent dehydrogenase (short-subunit alcohol dehydrogenase family)